MSFFCNFCSFFIISHFLRQFTLYWVKLPKLQAVWVGQGRSFVTNSQTKISTFIVTPAIKVVLLHTERIVQSYMSSTVRNLSVMWEHSYVENLIAWKVFCLLRAAFSLCISAQRWRSYVMATFLQLPSAKSWQSLFLFFVWKYFKTNIQTQMSKVTTEIFHTN